MKKNRMMRLASGLLVAVLATTSVISGTYAKYTTQDSANDAARVAKWGVELQVVGNLYGDTYGAATANNIVKKDATGFTVQSHDKLDDVVAPGTKNPEGFTFSLKGRPEVAGTVTTTMKVQNVFLEENVYGVMIPIDANVVTEANFDEFTVTTYNSTEEKFEEVTGLYYKTAAGYELATAWEAGKDYFTLEDVVDLTKKYYPIEYTLSAARGDNTTKYAATDVNSDGIIDGEFTNTLDEIAKVIKGESVLNLTSEVKNDDTTVVYSGTKNFDPNTDLATWNFDDLTLTWAWDFEQLAEANKTGDNGQMTDKADTILGMLISYRERADLSPDNLEGEVVKLDSTTYKVPTVYVDYCLDTQFSLDITVTQVD